MLLDMGRSYIAVKGSLMHFNLIIFCRKSLAAGFFMNSAELQRSGEFLTVSFLLIFRVKVIVSLKFANF